MGILNDLFGKKNRAENADKADKADKAVPADTTDGSGKPSKKPSTYCSSCKKPLCKGDAVYECSECYNYYCSDCGFMYKDTGDQPVCEICKGPLTYTYITW